MDIPDIHPFMFHIGGFGVRWYGFFMALSIGFGIWYLLRQGRRHHLSEDFLANLALVIVISGIVGARLVYVLTSPDAFLQSPALIPRIDMGGLSFHGAIIGGVLGGWWYASRYRVPLSPLMDWAVPGIAVGIVLVRMGNLFNREILGFPAEILGGARHVTQVYGSAIGIIVLLVYWYQRQRGVPDGYRFWTAAFVYSLLRGVNEFFKAQPSHYLIEYVNPYLGIGAVTLTQWLTPLFLFSAWLLMRRTKAVNLCWTPSQASSVYQDITGDDRPKRPKTP